MQPVCVCAYEHVGGCLCLPVSVCMFILYPLHRKFSHPAHSHHVHDFLLCPGGCITPRASLIGFKQASVKSHQRLEMLSETGNLLLGDFLQLPDSVCPFLSYCVSQYPSLLKSLIAAQFPSALFLSCSLSLGFKHSLFIARSPILDALSLSVVLFLCLPLND